MLFLLTGATYHDRVVKAVNTVHAAQRKLHQPKTPFAHNYTYIQARTWVPRARMWHARTLNPRWVIPAVFGKKNAKMALCVARAESGLNPKAHNASSAAGLYQLMSFWYNGSNAFHWRFNPYDQWQNAQHAAMLVRHDHSWRQWYGNPCVS
jgi:Lysozyme like domain